MDQGHHNIRQSMKETRRDMEETRASITEKIGLLEERVRETVEHAAAAVDDIVENVKDTVDETVGAVRETVGGAKSTVEEIVGGVKGTVDDTVIKVKQSFDLHYQMERRPWTMVSASVLMGYWLGSRQERTPRPASSEHHPIKTNMTRRSEEAKPAASPLPATPPAPKMKTRKSTLWSNTLDQFDEEINIVKKAIMGAMLSSLGAMAKQSMPSIAPRLDQALDGVMGKLGVHSRKQTQTREDVKQDSHADPDGGAQASHFPSATKEQQDQVTL